MQLYLSNNQAKVPGAFEAIRVSISGMCSGIKPKRAKKKSERVLGKYQACILKTIQKPMSTRLGVLRLALHMLVDAGGGATLYPVQNCA